MTDVPAGLPGQPAAEGLRFLVVACPVCGSDAAEPAAVGSDFAQRASRHTFLAMRCDCCGLVYLNPRPVASPSRPPPPGPVAPPPARSSRALAAARRLIRWVGPVSGSTRILVIGGARCALPALLRRMAPAGWMVEEASTPPASGSYDAVLLVESLEQMTDPVATLARLREVVPPQGLLVVRTPNADGALARLFGGRHWAGYDFPRRPCLYGPAALQRLAERAGWRVVELRGAGDAAEWRDSMANLLADWSAPTAIAQPARAGVALMGALRDWLERPPGLQRPWLEAVLHRAEPD